MKKCQTCELIKTIKAKGNCQNCWHKYKRKYNLNFFLRTRYTEIVQRCIKKDSPQSKYYYGMKYCSREEFLNKFLNNKIVKKLYKNWQLSNFEYKLCPSIDRIDKKIDYLIDNLQFITHSENCTKDQLMLPTKVYDRDDNLLGTFESLNDAVRHFKVQQSNAWKVAYGIRKHTCGYVFKVGKKA